MLETIWMRLMNGSQAIPDIRKARLHPSARSQVLPVEGPCVDHCSACAAACPVKAIEVPLDAGLHAASPVVIDRGKCVLCGDCVRACPSGKIISNPDIRTASSTREGLLSTVPPAGGPLVTPRKDLRRIFGRSLKFRSVCAGGCNACEMELNACGNVNFDMARFGLEFTASPRHADGLVITGPVTANMARALADSYEALPPPKLVIAVGSCAISGGLFTESPELDRGFFKSVKVDLYIPGCPPHPLTFINGILDLLGRR